VSECAAPGSASAEARRRLLVARLQLETGVDDCLIHVNFDFPVGMCDGDVVDQGARIGTRQNQRDLAHDSVRNPLGLLDQGPLAKIERAETSSCSTSVFAFLP
jgi:hypothetical protein